MVYHTKKRHKGKLVHDHEQQTEHESDSLTNHTSDSQVDKSTHSYTKNNKSYKSSSFLRIPTIAFIALFAVIGGIYLLRGSHAQTTQTSTTGNGAGLAASRMFGYGTTHVLGTSSHASFDAWNARGMKGAMEQDRYFYGDGGTDDYTTDSALLANTSLHQYDYQRQLMNSGNIAYLHSLGWKVYFGYYWSNYNNGDQNFMLGDVFPENDAYWNNKLSNIQHMAAAAKMMGIDGFFFDGEPYANGSCVQKDSAGHCIRHGGGSWGNQPGGWHLAESGSHTEAETRVAVKLRGQEVMQALMNGDPGAEISAYYAEFHGGWNEYEQYIVNSAPVANKDSMEINFWDGMTSVNGWKSLTLWDGTFEKGYGIGVSWDNALLNNWNGTMAGFSQPSTTANPWGGLSNWPNIYNKINVNTLPWVDPGSTNFEKVLPPDAATTAFVASRKWGGGEINDPGSYALYQNHGWPDSSFDYSGYSAAFAAGTAPGNVDNNPPTIAITSQTRSGNVVTFTGTSGDDFALKAVTWSGPNSGAAQMTYVPTSTQYPTEPKKNTTSWQMNWTANVTVPTGVNVTFTATDIHNNTTSISTGGTSTDNPPVVSLSANPSTVTQGSSSSLTATATDTDSTPVAKVEFYDGSNLLCSDTTSPYTCNWNTTSSTSTGNHTLTAKAYDTASPSNTSSATTSVTVNAPSTGGTTTIDDNTTGTGQNQFDFTASAGTNPGSWTLSTPCTGAYNNTCHRDAGGTTGTYYQVRFTGTSVTGYQFKCTDNGIIDIYIDGVKKTSSDLYSSTCGTAFTPVYTVSGLTNTAHTLKVVANGKNPASTGYGQDVDRVDVSTASTTQPPTAPTNLKVYAMSSKSVVLTWTASTSTGSTITSYTIFRNGTQVGTVSGASLAYSDSTVSPSTTYNNPGYTVIATDSAGNPSPASTPLVVTTPAAGDTQPPTAPSNVTTVATAYNNIRINWTKSNDNVGVAWYQIRRSKAGGPIYVIKTIAASNLVFNDNTVSPSTKYSYSVVAEDAAHNASPVSNTSSSTTPAHSDTTAPTTPTNLTATEISTSQVNLSWTASTDNVGVAAYIINRTGGSGPTSFLSQTNSFGDGTVASGNSYSYTVEALDNAGNTSPASAPASVTITNSSVALVINKASSAPTIDGNLSEYTGATPISFTNTKGNSVSVRALWDSNALYLAYNVSDTKLNGTVTTHDGPVWGDDAVEWFIDTLHNGGGSNTPSSPYMLPDDYQGIANVLGTQFDDQGTSTGNPSAAWNGSWQVATKTQGTVGNNSDTDSGWQAEIRIPWTSIGYSSAPANNSQVGLSFALDDKDATSSTSLMWGGVTSAFQNASKWQTVQLSGQVVARASTSSNRSIATNSKANNQVAYLSQVKGD